jgi:universal stress protein A
MLERVVVGIDFSEASFDAARAALAQFGRGAEIILAHAISFPDPPPIVRGRYPRRDLVVATLRAGAEKRLNDLRQSLPNSRIALEIREGDPAEFLARVAEDHSADLIVVGTHGNGVGYPLGSTAESLVRITRVPVLLARGPAAGLRNVLVATDEPARSPEAFRWSASVAREHGASVAVLRVMPGAVATKVRATAGAARPASSGERPDSGDFLGRWAVQAGVAPDRVSGETALGDPLREILAAAERIEADLIILSRRPGGNTRRRILGSVVDGVLRRAACAVLIVPHPDRVR